MILSCIYIDRTPMMGRGVFTSKVVEAGTIVEISPVIVMPRSEKEMLDKTLLHDYIFEWGENREYCCMGLGYLAVYNHSYRSNCEYEMDYETDTMRVRAVRIIRAGEELFINYNGDWDDEKPVWFETK